MYYVKNYNLFLDILILLQTVEVVLFGKGARQILLEYNRDEIRHCVYSHGCES
jgi:hypothetical protein